jgi:hypothetical protein
MFTNTMKQHFSESYPGYSLSDENGSSLCFGEADDAVCMSFSALFGLCLFHGMSLQEVMNEVKMAHASQLDFKKEVNKITQ